MGRDKRVSPRAVEREERADGIGKAGKERAVRFLITVMIPVEIPISAAGESAMAVFVASGHEERRNNLVLALHGRRDRAVRHRAGSARLRGSEIRASTTIFYYVYGLVWNY